MNTIDLENWKRSDTDHSRVEYVGQRTAQEVFEELYTINLDIDHYWF